MKSDYCCRSGLLASKSMLYVTHDQGEALALSDLIAVMRAGKILAVDRPQDIYNRPPNRFVAEFVGLANFLDGRVVEPGGEVLGLVETALHGPVHCTIPARLAVGELVIVSVRPSTSSSSASRRRRRPRTASWWER